ncbi:MAG: ATP-binding cassette domain-containing protein [Bacteroidia bacterium]|nr:ATP-binding cassette domain-containing protein [Bacteroidia bacterium]NNM15421.1 ATP-binding cassette domain-containing protein [Bacteroidia bacterium]
METNQIIKLEDVSIYIRNMLILNQVNLHVNQGEFVYLIGKTGSGKSSLLRVLYGDLPVTEGTAEFVDYDLTKLKRKQIPYLRRKLGIVFQDFQLLSDRSAFDNLKFILKATGWKNKTEMTDRIDQVLDKVGLGTKGYKYPHQLSGGEQQRLAIARALLNEPEVILADEPTGNLDPETTAGIMDLMFEISKSGRAVLMATHNYTLFEKYPARIVKCELGKIIETQEGVELENI